MVYASTGEMRCYECGAIGHVRLSCPVSAVAGPSGIQTEVQVNSHRNQTVIHTEEVENDKEIPTEEVRNDEDVVIDSVRKEKELSDGMSKGLKEMRYRCLIQMMWEGWRSDKQRM